MGANLALARQNKKICWDFAHALLELAVWLQAGEDHAIAIAAGSGQQSGLKKRLSSPSPRGGVSGQKPEGSPVI
jgi:hypothetical protein